MYGTRIGKIRNFLFFMLGPIWALVNLFFNLFFFHLRICSGLGAFVYFPKKGCYEKKEYSNSKSSTNYRKIVPNVVKYCQTISSKYVFC